MLLRDLLFPAVGDPSFSVLDKPTDGGQFFFLFAFYSSDLLFPAIGDPIIFGSFTYLCTVAIFILFVSVFRSTDALLYQS